MDRPSHLENGHPGTVDGVATHAVKVLDRSEPRRGRPGAAVIIDEPSAKVIAFEFGTGDELKERAAHHAVIVQALRGRA